jgi:hypothetical protein
MDTYFRWFDPEDEGTTVLKTSGPTYPETDCNIPESLNLKEHWYENFKSCMTYVNLKNQQILPHKKRQDV